MTTHHDPDPTPAHGTPRPTKTAALERQLTTLRNSSIIVNAEIAETQRIIDNAVSTRTMLEQRINMIASDIATIEQMIIDLTDAYTNRLGD